MEDLNQRPEPECRPRKPILLQTSRSSLARAIVEAAFEKCDRLGVAVVLQESSKLRRVLNPHHFRYRHPNEN